MFDFTLSPCSSSGGRGASVGRYPAVPPHRSELVLGVRQHQLTRRDTLPFSNAPASVFRQRLTDRLEPQYARSCIRLARARIIRSRLRPTAGSRRYTFRQASLSSCVDRSGNLGFDVVNFGAARFVAAGASLSGEPVAGVAGASGYHHPTRLLTLTRRCKGSTGHQVDGAP